MEEDVLPAIVVDHAPAESDLRVIANGVILYGRAEVVARGGSADPERFAVLLRHGEALIGGAGCRIELGRLFVEYLWVADAWRGRGHGAALLRRAELTGAELGCTGVLLETLSDRASEFYARAGYRLIADVADYIPGFAKRIFLKDLLPAA